MNPHVFPILVAVLFAGPSLADDVLSRSQQVGHELRVGASSALQRMALQQGSPWAVADVALRSLNAQAQERIHVLADDGRAAFSPQDELSLSPELARRLRSEPLGVGTYHAFNADLSDVVRRDLGWSRQTLAGREWIVVVERDRPLERVTEEPLTGRWLGAYSYTRIQAGDEPVAKEAGPLSVLILQEGDRCQLNAVSQRWNVLCAGVVAGTNLAAAADSSPGRPTVILDAGYAPLEDKIRGRLHLVGGDEAGRATIFLQRAPE